MELPNINHDLLPTPTLTQLEPVGNYDHPPRFLLLYGSLRERSFSRF
jgi:arsenic resistance protein ArsH